MLGVGLKRKEAQQLSADWRGDQMAVRMEQGRQWKTPGRKNWEWLLQKKQEGTQRKPGGAVGRDGKAPGKGESRAKSGEQKTAWRRGEKTDSLRNRG